MWNPSAKSTPRRRPAWRLPAGRLAVLALAGIALSLAGCGVSSASGGEKGRLQVVAAENFWGSIAGQVGGDHVQVVSIITNPATDPHSYEPNPADARIVAGASYVIVNGAGYDPWAQKLLDANPVSARDVLNVADLAGRHEGDNPHMWYSPAIVRRVVNRITADLKRLDPSDAASLQAQHDHFLKVGLRQYHALLAGIGRGYARTPVGATESIFVDLARSLRLNLITPPGFMKDISEGQEPTASDKATFDEQITRRTIKVFVYNKQNATPDTDELEKKSLAAGIPVVAITETLDPSSLTFQAWQVAQLTALEHALAKGVGH